ncbi:MULTISPECIES: CPBP family intramembrane glutamic endopeptidase [Clostridium]|jgi:membrane protease YdiL (CAAX protease family)|uniref:CAAX amino terminal protease self-immunity n=1 Tax=Clostridium acetireducens DSM 10703 TaxID=1121290 RepID=A0A1E8EYK7_9CLOT|nr:MULTISPECIES: CPBP family intramembrane glutamic endopeptidase [Clostridium]NMA57468.1 CPBP family intramembrane metalloprotease [Clostridium cochlearium]OFI06051.1 CAAX amino terminal protease self- immunity [Clostridium acetireducens DSM 10703]
MNERLRKVNSYLSSLSPIKFIIVMTALTYLIIIPFIPLFYLAEKHIGPMGGAAEDINQLSFIGKILIASILAPLLETLVFQYGVIEVLDFINFSKYRQAILIVISSIAFGMSHCYSVIYMVYGFLIGLVLAYSYMLYKKKDFSAFGVVFWIHCLRNTISTLLYLI